MTGHGLVANLQSCQQRAAVLQFVQGFETIREKRERICVRHLRRLLKQYPSVFRVG